jgi:tetratricopeptide (TPR) repeat protein
LTEEVSLKWIPNQANYGFWPGRGPARHVRCFAVGTNAKTVTSQRSGVYSLVTGKAEWNSRLKVNSHKTITDRIHPAFEQLVDLRARYVTGSKEPMLSGKCSDLRCRRLGVRFALIVSIAIGVTGALGAQQESNSPGLELGIIVTPAAEQAEKVIKDFKSGTDFGVLAKENSIDSTADDGGYMGRMNPIQLEPELRDAVRAIKPGQVTGVVRVPNGFAVLTIFPEAPHPQHLTTQAQLSVFIDAGAIRNSPNVGGFIEAENAFMSFPKPEGWNRDLREICEIRKQSYAGAIAQTQQVLASEKAEGAEQSNDALQTHLRLAQLYAYGGNMEREIEQDKLALDIAQSNFPHTAPQIWQVLGAAYLHLSEMENGVYHSTGDLGIFPPATPGEHYEKQEESKLAIQYLEKYLEQQPDDDQVRWLLNFAYATLGEYPDKVPPAQLIPPSDFQSPQDIGRFKDIAHAAGTDAFIAAGGIVVDDFDNDGLLDIVASSVDVCDPLHFYHNNGDGTFTDRAVQAGLADQLGANNLVQVDYNNDGCMDLLILRGAWEFPMRKSLLRNNCDGTFTDVTDQSGLGKTVTATNSAVWADINNDGYLDLFIANENSPSQLFRNRGDGTFEDISHAAGIDKTAFSKGVTAADYDNDGYVDFYVSNIDGPNYLYRNNHDGTFTDIAKQAGVQAPGTGFATWFFDYDNDGWPDLFVTSYPSYYPGEAVRSYMHQPYYVDTMKLYRNLHNGTFQDVTAQVGLDRVFTPMGANFGDVGNDGFLDIYLGMGSPSFGSILPHELLKNNGGKTFVDITASSGTGELHKGHGTGFADLFRRGHEDIVANVSGAIPSDKHTLRLFENPGNDNDWINVRLAGVKSNRAAVGARIKVTVENDGHVVRSIYRTVGYGSSFGGNPMEQHIGLGHGARITDLDIWWPATDTRQHFSNLAKNQFILVKEFANEYTKLDRQPVSLSGSNRAAGSK